MFTIKNRILKVKMPTKYIVANIRKCSFVLLSFTSGKPRIFFASFWQTKSVIIIIHEEATNQKSIIQS